MMRDEQLNTEKWKVPGGTLDITFGKKKNSGGMNTVLLTSELGYD